LPENHHERNSQTTVPVSGGAQRSISGTVRPAAPSIQNKMNS
jgi:hypothetical protein